MKRSVRSLLLGLALGEAAALAFLLVMALFALNAEMQTGSRGPLADTLGLWRALAVSAAPAGALLGLIAARVRRRRRPRGRDRHHDEPGSARAARR